MPRCVAFDCDGVLTQGVSSWKTLHEHFGTTSGDLYQAYLDGQISDEEFLEEDIRRWKAINPRIKARYLTRPGTLARHIYGLPPLPPTLLGLELQG